MANLHREYWEPYWAAYNSTTPYRIYCHPNEVELWKRRMQKEKQHHKKSNKRVTKLRLVFNYLQKAGCLEITFRDWNKVTKQMKG